MKTTLIKVASKNCKEMVKYAINETKRELQLQYGAKLLEQQNMIESCLNNLKTLTAEMKSQRELNLHRELVNLKQKNAIQSDQHLVYDIHLSHAWCGLCRKWLGTGLVKPAQNHSPLINDEGLDLKEHRRK